MATIYVVMTTAPGREEAQRLARLLVVERLAACVNVVPGVVSHYRWKGEIQEDEEWLLMAKTSGSRVEGLTRRIEEVHPYELPEVVAVPVEGGSPAYLEWVLEAVRGESS